MGLANTAKNEGWQSALIFCYFFIKEKVRMVNGKLWQLLDSWLF
jgi:hypothetical protein